MQSQRVNQLISPRAVITWRDSDQEKHFILNSVHCGKNVMAAVSADLPLLSSLWFWVFGFGRFILCRDSLRQCSVDLMQWILILRYILRGPQSVIWTLSKLTYCMDSSTHMALWGALFAAPSAADRHPQLMRRPCCRCSVSTGYDCTTSHCHLVSEDNQVDLDIAPFHQLRTTALTFALL